MKKLFNGETLRNDADEIRIFILLSSLLLFSCEKADTEANAPYPIRRKIAKYNNDSALKCLDKVIEYIYDGKKVYLFQQYCPDSQANLFNKLSKKICSPWGGFSGTGDLKCTNFSETAEFIRVIWER